MIHLPFPLTSPIFLLLTLAIIVASFFLGRRMGREEAAEPREFSFAMTKDGCLGVHLVLSAGSRLIELHPFTTREMSCEIARTILAKDAGGLEEPPTAPPSEPTPPLTGMVVPFDVQLHGEQGWDERRLHIRIDLPAKIHDRTEVITALGLTKWHKNPAVLDINGFGGHHSKFPIGKGMASIVEGRCIDLTLQMMTATEEATAAIQGLRNGKCALCAYVVITGEEGEGWKGDLVAIEVYLTGENSTKHVERSE